MSARLRLTLSYAGFLVIAGAAMMALLFYIIRFVPEGNLQAGTGRAPRGDGLQPGPVFVPDRSDLLDALWPRTWQVLGMLVVIGLVGGWFLAGRMLRPLQRIHEVALRVAAGSLEPRVRLQGPADEFRELADTFDSMMDRLARSFEEQRRFAANASHELRTPYAIERSMLDVALADPAGIDVDELLRRLDETNRRGTETVEALLTLSRLDQGQLPPTVPLDLAEITAEVVDRLKPLADEAGVALETSLDEGTSTAMRRCSASWSPIWCSTGSATTSAPVDASGSSRPPRSTAARACWSPTPARSSHETSSARSPSPSSEGSAAVRPRGAASAWRSWPGSRVCTEPSWT